MSFNLSDYFLKDIIYTAKENLENDFFKLTIDNIDYPILISRVATALMELTVYSRTRQINDDNPIEKRVIEYNNIRKEEGSDYLLEKYGKDWDVDFFNPEKFFLHPNLNNILENHAFEFHDINEKTNDFLKSLIKEGDLIFLSSCEISYKELENSTSELEVKIKNVINEKCIKEYDNNNHLQNSLIEVNNKRIEDEKEKEKHMQSVKEKEHKIQEYNDNLEVPERKNLNDYNIGYR